MTQEIERKYLVAGESWRTDVSGAREIVQRYLAVTERAEIRVRIVDGTQAALTIKSARAALVREEVEMPLPVAQAMALLDMGVGRTVRKVRHLCPVPDGTCWEIDEFQGDLAGLVIAEIELPDPDAAIPQPDWLGEEVTGDARYYNSHLAGVDAE
ncbi:CYTH domain-containing protein [Croceicoccus bisphenolivorans]|uniref:CYTH domain-containing protein n=1 Tax=Croceicoccus bisphenolivorans TaxID=1783232 RepID=UPI000831283D|nr:CYTH domain-containing protein [Croceicoccus bisphenolivorans]